MRLYKLFTVITMFSPLRSRLMNTKKLCKDCKHFIPTMGDCGIFGETNLVTGKETYEYASSVRRDNNKCGENATRFEQNNIKMITTPYYFFSDNWPIMFVVMISGYLIVLSQVVKKN